LCPPVLLCCNTAGLEDTTNQAPHGTRDCMYVHLRNSSWRTQLCPKHVELNNANKIVRILKQSTSSWDFIQSYNHENLVFKSSGSYRFKCPGPRSVSRLYVTLFGCMSILARWFVLNFVISSLMVGICRSVCRSLFGTYHGALTIVLRVLFWKRWRISMLEWEAVPQSGILV